MERAFVSTGFVIVFFGAVVVTWLVLGGTFAAAFKAPFAMLLPGLALLLAHTILFDNYEALPGTAIALVSLIGTYLFGLMCLRVVFPKAEEKSAGENA